MNSEHWSTQVIMINIPHCTRMMSTEKYCSVLFINVEQDWSSLHNTHLCKGTLIIIDWNRQSSSLIFTDHHWLKLIKTEQYSSVQGNPDHHWIILTVIITDHYWSKLIKTEQFSSVQGKTDHNWLILTVIITDHH